ncbi:MAG TPA: alpha-amylase family glycosyl hydrolase, partial [bacterium]|nr:alpha-amylase family glycosyl hydrolase [bacterium]
FLDTDDPNAKITFRVSIELYMRGVTDVSRMEDGDIDVALWTDADRHGFIDKKGIHYPDFGRKFMMKIARDENGAPVKNGNNAVFMSEPVEITKTGVFSFTPEFSADERRFESAGKTWIALNDITMSRDVVIVVTPRKIRACPSLMEICVRKYGAGMSKGRFVSGKFANVTRDMENIPVNVLYMLPFFEPGTGDILTGEDVRKGELGSIYAVKDFYRLDPALCSDPHAADFRALAEKELITEYDLVDLLDEKKTAKLSRISDLNDFDGSEELIEYIGEDAAVQLVGRADLRELVRTAHSCGKLVIFDLVLMQTSRDSRLIIEHRDWYALDEKGAPKKHSIAWLDYSDVALFDLMYNRPLQNYISAVAPYWITACELDGVRIDASQTIDRAFLKQIKNRINEVRPDAIVMGETLCPMEEAVDIPVDIIYSLLVDHHVHIENARPYYDLFETYHHTFSHGTQAMAYFENHDSRRATEQWSERYSELLKNDKDASAMWADAIGDKFSEPTESILSCLKNIQCSLINVVSGSRDAVNFCYAIENGTDFGECVRTDFEHETIIDFGRREKGAGAELHKTYSALHALKKKLEIVCEGHVFYMRDNLDEEADDRIFALVRYNGGDVKRLLFLANLDPVRELKAAFKMDFLNLRAFTQYPLTVLFDTWKSLGLQPAKISRMADGKELSAGKMVFTLMPLQSLMISF